MVFYNLENLNIKDNGEVEDDGVKYILLRMLKLKHM